MQCCLQKAFFNTSSKEGKVCFHEQTEEEKGMTLGKKAEPDRLGVSLHSGVGSDLHGRASIR